MQPTVLAPVSVYTVDHAILVPRTLIVDDRRLGPPEEAFAALAGDHAIMNTAALVATHLARDYFDLG